MKKIILTLVFSIVSILLTAQSVLDKYAKQEGVSSILVNKKMFQMMGNVKVDSNDPETQQYLALIKKLDNLKVYTTSNAKISSDMQVTVGQYVKSSGLEEMMTVNDNGNTVRIWVKSGATENEIKELLMFNDEPNAKNETILMSLTGNFDLNEIAVLTDKMKIPGGDDLKKATKGK
ncbi:DUF4252 domain-containing protein [Flavobacterium nackdongense]|uniref:DUF4252 domain-containing protein n=1 Tax=Flavobacterium nackdongense TaxID=2547394 RepID=A0A4V1AGL8_9FLAO|nr:DUF4252 domain-containing protein [Flavobacterium nackdongense]QBN18492.1 DUF4252 domain-containing protein [Flavobacterium nackdongense]